MKNGVKNETGLLSALGESLRLAYFLFWITLVFLVMGPFGVVPCVLLSFIWKPARWGADVVMCRGIRFLMWTQFWLRARVEIRKVSGNPGVLMVSNHRSHLDVFMLLSRVHGIRVLAKSSLFKIPFLGWMMHASRQIPVARGSVVGFTKAMDEIRSRLRQGETVHVFPEMTRCPGGFEGLLPFALAPFHAAIQEGALIQPLVIQGTDSYWPREIFGIRRGSGVNIRSLDPISAKDFTSAESLKTQVQEGIRGALA